MAISTLVSGYQALREGAAWIDLSSRGKIRVTGEDRARLLHAMTTNQVQQLQPGQGCYAFFLNAQGRILGDVNLFCFEDHLLLDTEPETRVKLYEHLDRYIIADDVTLEDVTDHMATLAVEGSRASGVLRQADAPVPAGDYDHAAWGSATVARLSFTGLGGFLLFTPVEDKPALAAKLGIVEASLDEARVVRIENGRPRYGEEITERYLVQETGQIHAVNFTKGCYLGQEIVERVRSRAQIHRVLRRLELDTAHPPEPGAKLTHGEAPAGEIASAAYSPALGKTVALAYMRVPFTEPGSEASVDGVTARVL